jgi:NAD(P)-dependent dehydrogenase (short-subunit alcohol dehydrogenase family)
MLPLTGNNMVVIGGSRGVGRRIVKPLPAMARACLRWRDRSFRSGN